MTSEGDVPKLPPTPDFDSYTIPAEIVRVEREQEGAILRLQWSDGRLSRYHAIWLRDNASDPDNLNLETREQRSDVTALPEGLRAESARVDRSGALVVRWSNGGTISRFHPGWLYAHDYSGPRPGGEVAAAAIPWHAETLGAPPSFDGAEVLEDDAALEAWSKALVTHGIARLRNLPVREGMVARVAERLGPVRETNFGRVFDVRVKTGPGSNAYTALALTPHTDLPTREYQPGLQLLHCLRASSRGGQAIVVDGLRLAETLRQKHPEAFAHLTEIEWRSSNRSPDTDYRWQSPVICLDEAGGIRELRVVPFLRAPLAVAFDKVEAAYRSLRTFYQAVADSELQLRFDYRPGDLVGFDNRRVLHGREAYDPAAGERWLQGCYLEREELHSRLRILARRRRAAEVAGTKNP